MPETHDAEQQVRALATWLDDEVPPVTLTEVSASLVNPTTSEAPAPIDLRSDACYNRRGHDRVLLAAAAVVAVIAIVGGVLALSGDDDNADLTTEVTVPGTDLTQGWERIGLEENNTLLGLGG